MTARRRPEKRVLAVNPTTRGFGFVVLEGSDQLVDWGVAHVRTDKEARTLARVSELLERYRPDVLVLEDSGVPGTRRRERVRKLLRELTALAPRRGVRVRRIARREVRRAFSAENAVTKSEIAAAIAKRFPELAPRLPPRRKAWMSEDERMAIFDAAAFALTFLDVTARRGDRKRSSVHRFSSGERLVS